MKGKDTMRLNNLIIGGVLFMALLFSGCAVNNKSSVRHTLGTHTVQHEEGDLYNHMQEHTSYEECEPKVALSNRNYGKIPLYELLL